MQEALIYRLQKKNRATNKQQQQQQRPKSQVLHTVVGRGTFLLLSHAINYSCFWSGWPHKRIKCACDSFYPDGRGASKIGGGGGGGMTKTMEGLMKPDLLFLFS